MLMRNIRDVAVKTPIILTMKLASFPFSIPYLAQIEIESILEKNALITVCSPEALIGRDEAGTCNPDPAHDLNQGNAQGN